MKRLSNRFSVLVIYVSKVMNSILSFLIIYVVTRKLNSSIEFGKYSYGMTITTYVSLFFGFGFNDALTNIVVNCKEEQRAKEFCGVGYLLNIVLGLMYFLSIFIFKFFTHETYISFLVAIFSQSLILNDLLNRMALSLKRPDLIVLNNFLIYTTVLIAFILFNTNYTNYLMIYFIVYFFYTNLLYLHILKPKFKNLRLHFKKVWKKTREYGFNAYIGRLASCGTYDMDKLMIKAYSPVQNVGFYNLGLSCTSPITMFSDSLMAVIFKDMADKDRISKKVLYVNVIWLLLVSICFATVGKYIFLWFLGDKYKTVSDNFIGFGVLAFFRGLYVPFNNFLGVKGFGKYLRNTAFMLTISNVVTNVLLIPKYHMVGAIYATIISLIVDDIAYFYYYKKAVKHLKMNS